MKSDPDCEYAWEDLVKSKTDMWDGVRNYAARNHMKSMKRGDKVLFYHSGKQRAVVGVARVAREAYPDPTAKDGDWVCVDVSAVKPLAQPVTLDDVKARATLKDMALVRIGRLSVQPVKKQEWDTILKMGSTKA